MARPKSWIGPLNPNIPIFSETGCRIERLWQNESRPVPLHQRSTGTTLRLVTCTDAGNARASESRTRSEESASESLGAP